MIRLTLVTDGSSDRSLIPIVNWAIREAGVVEDLNLQWADLGNLRNKPKTLADKLKVALDLYPCDLLLVHRDAEKETTQKRRDEIAAAVEASEISSPYVCVVPVRMQESWLLFDEYAIRLAAGNPNGECVLAVPALKEIEKIPDPKDVLFTLLRAASELSGRRLKKFDCGTARARVCDFIQDFSPLRQLPSFLAFEDQLKVVVREQSLENQLDRAIGDA